MEHAQTEPNVKGLSPLLVGLILGASVALPMYLWQSNFQIAVACFVIAGYTAFLWTQSHNHIAMTALLYGELRKLQLNSMPRRIFRMLVDLGFWWTIIVGGAIVTSTVWWAGVTQPITLGGVFGAWCFIGTCLSFGLTLMHPAAGCRRCGYDLSGHLIAEPESTVIRCPECSARWSRSQLGQGASSMDWRRQVA